MHYPSAGAGAMEFKVTPWIDLAQLRKQLDQCYTHTHMYILYIYIYIVCNVVYIAAARHNRAVYSCGAMIMITQTYGDITCNAQL